MVSRGAMFLSCTVKIFPGRPHASDAARRGSGSARRAARATLELGRAPLARPGLLMRATERSMVLPNSSRTRSRNFAAVGAGRSVAELVDPALRARARIQHRHLEQAGGEVHLGLVHAGVLHRAGGREPRDDQRHLVEPGLVGIARRCALGCQRGWRAARYCVAPGCSRRRSAPSGRVADRRRVDAGAGDAQQSAPRDWRGQHQIAQQAPARAPRRRRRHAAPPPAARASPAARR